MEWINKILDKDIRLEISNDDALIRKISVLIPMSATEIKNNNSNLLKGISIRISDILFESGILTESQHNRIKKKKHSTKRGMIKKL